MSTTDSGSPSPLMAKGEGNNAPSSTTSTLTAAETIESDRVGVLRVTIDRCCSILKENQHRQICLVAEQSRCFKRTNNPEVQARYNELKAQHNAAKEEQAEIVRELARFQWALSVLEDRLPTSSEEDLLDSVCNFLGCEKEALLLVPGRRFPLMSSLPLKEIPQLPEFPDLEMVRQRAPSGDIVFHFLRTFECRLKRYTGNELFEILAYPYMRKAILEPKVLKDFERLMALIEATDAWPWNTCKSMFLLAVDHESAIGDSIQRLYTIKPLENEDYRAFISRIRGLCEQIPIGDGANCVSRYYSIVSSISDEGRTKVKSHFGDIESIPSWEALLTFLETQTGSPYGHRSYGYRPSAHILEEARHAYPNAQSGQSARPDNGRSIVRYHPSKALLSKGSQNSITAPVVNKYCHFCHKPGHDKSECYRLLRKNRQKPAPLAMRSSCPQSENVGRDRSSSRGGHSRESRAVKPNSVHTASGTAKRLRTNSDSEISLGESECLPLYQQGLNPDEATKKILDLLADI